MTEEYRLDNYPLHVGDTVHVWKEHAYDDTTATITGIRADPAQERALYLTTAEGVDLILTGVDGTHTATLAQPNEAEPDLQYEVYANENHHLLHLMATDIGKAAQEVAALPHLTAPDGRNVDYGEVERRLAALLALTEEALANVQELSD